MGYGGDASAARDVCECVRESKGKFPTARKRILTFWFFLELPVPYWMDGGVFSWHYRVRIRGCKAMHRAQGCRAFTYHTVLEVSSPKKGHTITVYTCYSHFFGYFILFYFLLFIFIFILFFNTMTSNFL